MTDQPAPDENHAAGRAHRDRVVWLIPLLIVATLAGVVAWRAFRHERFAWLRLPQDTIRVRNDSPRLERVPAAPGDLRGANLLLITLDTTRAGRLGCYGNSSIATPALDSLAHTGVFFTEALSPTPTTLPTHTSIHTGLYPVHHGVRANGRFRLAERHETLAETLKANGYATAAIVSAFVLDSQFGLNQGFDRYHDNIAIDGFNAELGAAERRAQVTVDRALRWLDELSEQAPFFLWLHLFDPHANYTPPEPYASRYAANPYDGEIAYVDAQIARLLARLTDRGLAEQTLIVVTGDHGEALGEHGEHTHGYLLYDVTLRVPLILHCGHRLGGGGHVDRRVSLVDVAPTVMSLLGITPPALLDGVDLLQPPDDARPIFAETYHGWMEYGWAALLAVYSGNYKYIHSPEAELFDLAADPREETSLLAGTGEGERRERMLADLRRLFGDEVAGDVAMSDAQSLSPEDLQRLQALGYAFGGDARTGAGRPRPDPKTRIEIVNRIFEIRCYYSPRGLHAEAVRLLEKLCARFPDSYSAHYNLALSYWDNNQLDEAAEALRECMTLEPAAPEAPHRLALLLMAEGDYPQAVELLSELVQRQSSDLSVHCDLAAALSGLKRYREAAEHARIAFSLDPTSPQAIASIAICLPRLGESDELRRTLRDAVAADPRRFRARRELAGQLLRIHRDDEAVTLLREGVAADPMAVAPRVLLAHYLLQSPASARQNADEARALLEPLGDLANVSDATVLRDAAKAWEALGAPARAAELTRRAEKSVVP